MPESDSLFYHWEAIDADDNVRDTSNTVKVVIKEAADSTNNNESGNSGENTTVSVYPNPVHAGTSFTLEMKDLTAGSVVIRIANPTGQIVRRLKTQVGSGDKNVSVSTVGLPGGIYFIKIVNLKDTKRYKLKIVIE